MRRSAAIYLCDHAAVFVNHVRPLRDVIARDDVVHIENTEFFAGRESDRSHVLPFETGVG